MTKIKNLVMGLIFILVFIPGAWADAVQTKSMDEPVFWQPDAIVSALKKMGTSEEKFIEFIDLYFNQINSSWGTKKISAFDVGYIWLTVFADMDTNDDISDQDYERLVNFINLLIEEQNNLVDKLISDVNQKSMTNNEILNVDSAANIFESVMSAKCNAVLSSTLNMYSRRGLPRPEVINKQSRCVPVSGGADNTFSCYYSHELQGTNTACLIECAQVEFDKSDIGYSVVHTDCLPVQTVSAQSLNKY